MRSKSDSAEATWLAKDEKAMRERQEDFIRHCGGKIHIKPSTVVPGEVVDVPPHAKRLEEIRKQYPQAYTPWTEAQEAHLTELHAADTSIGEIAKRMERHPGGIRSRLKKMGLTE
jgi:DNA-directed RNA polymerase specialized sigma24 family protein